ncbi:MAG TPA: DUF2231 domain-containing protein [Pseudolabrys sp.]|jgi:uncharacterized membrane protein|nr:DUF2231 domain-containing protein [Pseudolabrys sp.]
MRNPRSTASIGGHPVHPIVVPFPILFFAAAFVCDLAFWRTASAFFASASLWLIGCGLIMAALAAVLGFIDVAGDAEIRNIGDVWLHASGNVCAVLLELYNWYSRYQYGATVVVPIGLILSLLVLLLLLFTVWKGWQLVNHHRVGVADEVVAE